MACNQSSVAVQMCLFSRVNQEREGDRDTETVKQIASHRPAQSHHETDRCS